MKAARALTLAVALLSVSLTGCLGLFGKDDAPAEVVLDDEVTISNRTLEKVDSIAAKKPTRYTFPVPGGAPAVDTATAYFNGTIGPEANAAVEGSQDRGGTSHGSIVQTQDFSSLVPSGQPTLVNIRLWFDNKPGSSADLDIYVDAYGVKTHENREYADEMSWTLPVKTMSVTTIGADEPTLIGVQAANGRMLPTGGVDYWMRIEFVYGEDVASQKIPYALNVNENVTGLIVESVKFRGDTHVKGSFMIVGPDDELVQAMDFDDIAIPTQSVYVPLRGPGEYVFYVSHVKNGFFAVRADAGLDDPVARPLKIAQTDTVLVTDPVAPGVAEHHAYDPATEYTEGVAKGFNVEGNFPLEIHAFIQGEGLTGDVELRVLSPAGLVSKYHRFLRYDSGGESIGASDEDIEENRVFTPANLRKGAYTLSAVVNGMQGQAGVSVVTYER